MEESLAKSTLKVQEGDETLFKEDTDLVGHVDVKQLPSRFIGYPEGTKISYKPITLDELEALNSDELDPVRAVAMLLKSIHCTTLPVEELYYWDVIYIGIQRKLFALGGTKGTIYEQCPKCGNLVSKTFDYTELDFKELSVQALPMRLDIGGKKVEFSLLTMKDLLQLKPTDGELGVYARMIKNLPFEEALPLVKNATGIDIKKIRFVDKQLDYGIKPFFVECENTVEVETPDHKKIKQPCKTRVALEVRSPFEIVFPEGELEGFDEFEVQYG